MNALCQHSAVCSTHPCLMHNANYIHSEHPSQAGLPASRSTERQKAAKCAVGYQQAIQLTSPSRAAHNKAVALSACIQQAIQRAAKLRLKHKDRKPNQHNKQGMERTEQQAGLPGMQKPLDASRPMMATASPQAFTQGNRQVPSLESRPRPNAGKSHSMMPQIQNNADRLDAVTQPAVCGAVEVWTNRETQQSTSSGSLGYWLRCNGTKLH
jgi:hypothetical protein